MTLEFLYVNFVNFTYTSIIYIKRNLNLQTNNLDTSL